MVWLLILLLSTYSRTSFGYDSAASLIFEDSATSSKIEGLKIQPELSGAQLQKVFEKQLVVIIQGEYAREGWRLYCNNHVVEHRLSPRTGEPETSKFAIPLQLVGESTSADFTAIGPSGAKEFQQVKIEFKEWEQALTELGLPRPSIVQAPSPEIENPLAKYDKSSPESKKASSNLPSKLPGNLLGVGTSVGFTSIQYQETGVPDFSENAVTLKVAYERPLSDSWTLGTNAFANIFSFNSSRPDATVEFVGINLRLGYTIPFVHKPWQFMIMAGAYFNDMFVTDSKFGYSALLYPQFYPVLRRTFDSGSRLSIYFKYVPINAGYTVFSSSELEYSLGTSFSWTLKNSHPVALSLDYSNLHFNPQEAATSRLTTVSFGFGYGL